MVRKHRDIALIPDADEAVILATWDNYDVGAPAKYESADRTDDAQISPASAITRASFLSTTYAAI